MMSVGRRPKLRREGGNRRWPAVMLPADPSLLKRMDLRL